MAEQQSEEARVITTISRPHIVTYINAAWTRLCGFNSREQVGQSLKTIQVSECGDERASEGRRKRELGGGG